MATELCGTKIIAPYFGSSLYVWASVIAVTLGSLAAGYFFGGISSLTDNKIKRLSLFLLTAALYMGCMPFISNIFKYTATLFSLMPAVIFSTFILLFLPMFLMGAASPIIISIQTQHSDKAGKVSGLVYSISTLGGILATFASGFFLIPFYGVNATLIIFSVLLCLSLLILVNTKNHFFKTTLVFCTLVFFGFSAKTNSKNCLYEKDGLLGKIHVINDTLVEENRTRIVRKLLVNNIVQTEMDVKTGLSVSDYVTNLNGNIDATDSADALILGLGGGLTANLLIEKNYRVTGVEFDERIISAAKQFFNLHPKTETVLADARYYINNETKKYDLILIDVFKAEEQPAHVITSESLYKLKTQLKANAKLIINWHGYTSGENGKGTNVIVNTLKHAGFKCRFSALSDDEDYRNILIFASLNNFPELKNEKNIVLKIAEDIINTDNHPVLEKYNALANRAWRNNYIKYYYGN